MSPLRIKSEYDLLIGPFFTAINKLYSSTPENTRGTEWYFRLYACLPQSSKVDPTIISQLQAERTIEDICMYSIPEEASGTVKRARRYKAEAYISISMRLKPSNLVRPLIVALLLQLVL